MSLGIEQTGNKVHGVQTSEIDGRLQRYTAAEHRIGANLHELEQHSVYQLLTTDALAGATAKALAPSQTADPNLWALFILFSSALGNARRVRGTSSRLNAEERNELIQLLTGPSVIVTTENIPLSQRGLTGDMTQVKRLTMEQLIDQMSRLYEPIRDVITHAEAILRDVLPRLNSAESTVNRLRSEAQSLGLATIELDQVEETIERIRELSLVDPLSIPADARATFDTTIKAAAEAIARARSSHDELANDIAGASNLLDECRQLIALAEQGRSDAVAKIAHPVGLLRAPSTAAIDGGKGIASTLGPILNSTKRWQHIRSDLDAWSVRAGRLRDQLERVALANAQPLKRRDELRGRLGAFRAKMAAIGRSEDPVLGDLSAEAHNELYTSPTDLARAARLVAEFGERLASP